MPVSLSTDDRGFQPNLPPVEAISHPAIRAAMEAHQEAKAAAYQADLEVEGLRRVRPEVVAKDATALADAYEQGKPAPSAKHTERADRELAEAERKAEARRIVRSRKYSAMVQAFARREWERDVLAAFERHQAAYREAVARLSQEAAELAQARALLSFARGRRWIPAGGGSIEPQVPHLLRFADIPASGPQQQQQPGLVLVEQVA